VSADPAAAAPSGLVTFLFTDVKGGEGCDDRSRTSREQ
jgi:hypothetical protein